MQLRWAIVGGLAAGIAVAWWMSRDVPAPAGAPGQASADGDAGALPVLYRWTDESGVVQVTQEPPPRGRRYETVDIQPREGIEVDGRRR